MSEVCLFVGVEMNECFAALQDIYIPCAVVNNHQVPNLKVIQRFIDTLAAFSLCLSVPKVPKVT